MPPRITLKDHFLETRLFTQRAVFALVGMAALVGFLVVRLVYLQVINHELYITQSNDNRVKIVALPPTRGLIYDRNGVLLAENLPSYHLEITPEQVDDMDRTLAALAKIIDLREEDLQRFHKLLKRTRRFDGVPLRFHLSNEEVARFSINRHRFPGVDIAVRLSRHYPTGEHTVHAIGYVGRIDEEDLQRIDQANYSGTSHIGKIGVEKSYEDLLHGQAGYQQVETNAQGRVLRVLQETPPVPGKDLHLSLDYRLHLIAESALGTAKGALVAIEPTTGAVLALVSKPGYDPNPFVNGIDSASYQALQADDAHPLYNRAMRGQYPPGSTVKPFYGLAGLAYGVTSSSQRVYCPGFFRLPNVERKYRDWKREGHGALDLEGAIMQSCDVYFYTLAQSLGIDRMSEFMGRFGFGAPTGIDIVGERPGLFPSREWKQRARRQPWYPGETIITGIGQGYTLATPLQLASATATMAMRGKRFAPHIVHTIEDPATATVQPLAPAPLPGVEGVQDADWDRVFDGMVAVMRGPRGTARTTGLSAPYVIAGKTGTAQVFGMKQDEKYNEDEIEEKLRDHALFVAFAPAEEPRIAVAVIVENGGHGGSVSAPIARAVMDQYLLGGQP